MSKKVKEIKLSEEHYIPIHSVKWGEDVLMKLSNKTGMSLSDVKKILSYNVITVNQLALLTGYSDITIRRKTESRYLRRQKEYYSDLTVCYPFPTEEKGPTFILVDGKCSALINESIA